MAITKSYEYVYDGVPVADRTDVRAVSYEYVYDGVPVADAPPLAGGEQPKAHYYYQMLSKRRAS